MYNVSMEEAREGAVFPGVVLEVAHDWGQGLTFEGQTCSHFRAFTSKRRQEARGGDPRRGDLADIPREHASRGH